MKILVLGFHLQTIIVAKKKKKAFLIYNFTQAKNTTVSAKLRFLKHQVDFILGFIFLFNEGMIHDDQLKKYVKVLNTA